MGREAARQKSSEREGKKGGKREDMKLSYLIIIIIYYFDDDNDDDDRRRVEQVRVQRRVTMTLHCTLDVFIGLSSSVLLLHAMNKCGATAIEIPRRGTTPSHSPSSCRVPNQHSM
jgi:hypothetical protein